MIIQVRSIKKILKGAQKMAKKLGKWRTNIDEPPEDEVERVE